MIVLLLLALCLSIPLPSSVLTKTTFVSSQFQEKCRQVLPAKTKKLDTLAALVCGEKITDENLQEYLRRTSLIHIFVVSGSHLLLLDELLSILKIPFFLRFLFLSGYSLAVGWQAPAVRALLGLLLRKILRHRKYFFPQDLVVLLTGFLCLIAFPSWWNSQSFVMSWCAGLALATTDILRIKNPWARVFTTQGSIFIFMFAPLWGLGSLHPLSILFNIFLAPLVSYVLLPLGFFIILFPALTSLFDHVIALFTEIITTLSEPITMTSHDPISVCYLWAWILILHLLLHFLRLRLWQGRDLT